jgi:hypothetical protein
MARNNPWFNLTLWNLELEHRMISVVETSIPAPMGSRLQKTLSKGSGNWIHWLMQNQICIVPAKFSGESAAMRRDKSVGSKETRFTGTNSICRNETTLREEIHSGEAMIRRHVCPLCDYRRSFVTQSSVLKEIE